MLNDAMINSEINSYAQEFESHESYDERYLPNSVCEGNGSYYGLSTWDKIANEYE